jgi:hypothetical protein
MRNKLGTVPKRLFTATSNAREASGASEIEAGVGMRDISFLLLISLRSIDIKISESINNWCMEKFTIAHYGSINSVG